MADFGIPRIHDYQNTLPGVTGGRGVQGDKSSQEQNRPAPMGRKRGEAPGKSPAEAPGTSLQVPETLEELKKELEELNKLLGNNTSIRFVVNHETDHVFVEIIDTETKKVLKTIPRDEVPMVASRVRNGSFLVDSKS
jgi:uncharacterized FlaG/YvyC family protein